MILIDKHNNIVYKGDTVIEEDLYYNIDGKRIIKNNLTLIEIDVVPEKYEIYKYIDGEFIIKDETIELREQKIKQLSKDINEFIYNGFDFEINGEIKHFSMKLEDQTKLLGLASIVQNGASIVSWHANDDECIDFDAETFMNFYSVGSVMVSYFTTRFNTGLRPYIRNTELTKKEINDINIHFELPEEYQTKVLEMASKGVGKTVEKISPIIEAYGW